MWPLNDTRKMGGGQVERGEGHGDVGWSLEIRYSVLDMPQRRCLLEMSIG